MIGDWVSCDGKCYQIAELGGMVCLDAEKEIFASLEDITPIPITPEILEKNGWHIPKHKIWCQNDDVTFYMCRYTDGTYEIYADGDSEFSNFCNIRFVHELQHALKLCGIEKTIEL